MRLSPIFQPVHRLAAAILLAATLGGAPAMTWAHATSAMPEMSGPMPGHHSAPHHDPLASCCDLCVASCLSAPVFGTVLVPVVAAHVRRLPAERPASLSVALRIERFLPPAVGPPARA